MSGKSNGLYSLSEEELNIIRRHFVDGLTYYQIGKILGLTRQRIHQRSNNAVRKLLLDLFLRYGGVAPKVQHQFKHCYDCGLDLPITSFRFAPKNRDGYDVVCTECRSVRSHYSYLYRKYKNEPKRS